LRSWIIGVESIFIDSRRSQSKLTVNSL
jgi:hypothetical protein